MSEATKPEITGLLYKILPLVTFESGFKKQEFIVKTDEQYPQYLKFELTKDKISILNYVKLGDSCKVSFNIRGHEWINPEGKAVYFISFNAWRIVRLENGYVQPPDLPYQKNNLHHGIDVNKLPKSKDIFETPYNGTKYTEDDYDDLPF